MVIQLNSRGATRPITDAHKTNGDITLAHAIKISSNVAMAMFAKSRLGNVEQFESLRDFGFGAPTGSSIPRRPAAACASPTSGRSTARPSIAMGVRVPGDAGAARDRVRRDRQRRDPPDPDADQGSARPEEQTEYSHQPEPVRRAVSPGGAHPAGSTSRACSRKGTAEGRDFANYSLAGKTGTAVKSLGKAGYARDRYLVRGALSADDPQLVVVVKIDDPAGAYFGGETAAPVTARGMLEEALAARQSAIDRLRLVEEGHH
ncbi:MAG: penicillin-binding transpeptidase domain-containing protein [Gemmatimonadales bacterium]